MFTKYTAILRSPSIHKSSKLFNGSINGARYKHFIALASNSGITLDKNVTHTHGSSFNSYASTGLRFKRNFSISTVNRNIGTINTAESFSTGVLPDIPDIPSLSSISAPIESIVAATNALGEPTLAAVGLGGASPSGVVQTALESIHIFTGLPWWGTIAVTTVVIRILLTPLVVSAQKNSTVFVNSMGEIQAIQEKLNEARQTKNVLAFAEHSQEMTKLMQDKGYNPIKNLLVPLAQMPIFLSFYFGLRGMANAPVESFHTGGIAWFTDLTIADPYYILPVITCGTLWLTLRQATANAPMSLDTSRNLSIKALKVLPIFMFPFIISFPSALVMYWASSNICSLIQTIIFQIPSVRTYFNIPKHDPQPMPVQKAKFMDNAKGAWENLKLASEMEDRRRTQQLKGERKSDQV